MDFKCKNIKLLEENIECLWDLGLSEEFIDMAKTKIHKRKNN